MNGASLSLRPTAAILTLAVLVSGLIAGAIFYFESLLPLVPLPIALLLAYAFPKVLSNPIPVLAAFVLLAVNLNFVQFGNRFANADVILSGVLTWALILRFVLMKHSITRTPVEKTFLLFVVVTAASVLLSVSPAASLRRWGREVEYLVVFSLLLHYGLSAKDNRKLVAAVVWSSVIPCAAGFIGLYFGIDRLTGAEAPLEGGVYVPRMSGTTPHAVTLSLYLGIVALLTLSLLLDRRIMRRRVLVPLLALQLICMYLTYGRTGWASFAVGLVALLWLSGRRRVLILASPVMVVALWLFLPAFFDRWSTAMEVGDRNSLLFRFQLWLHALDVFGQRPVFGSGPGTFIEHVAFLEGFAAHQTWIGRLVETGVVGTLALVGLVFGVGGALMSRHRKTGTKDPVLNSALAVWFALMAGSLTSDTWGVPQIMIYFWVLAGISLRRLPVLSPSPGGRSAPGEAPRG